MYYEMRTPEINSRPWPFWHMCSAGLTQRLRVGCGMFESEIWSNREVTAVIQRLLILRVLSLTSLTNCTLVQVVSTSQYLSYSQGRLNSPSILVLSISTCFHCKRYPFHQRVASDFRQILYHACPLPLARRIGPFFFQPVKHWNRSGRTILPVGVVTDLLSCGFIKWELNGFIRPGPVFPDNPWVSPLIIGHSGMAHAHGTCKFSVALM